MNDYPFQAVPCDKTDWPEGPWKGDEPNAVSWQATWGPDALQCAMIRHSSMGHWCGYVRVPDHHPLRFKSYSDRAKFPKAWLERSVRQAAPLIFAIGQDIGVISLFCASAHLSEDLSEGTLDLIFHCHGGLTYSNNGWFGFDCAHSGDLSPRMARYHSCYMDSDNVYRDFAYVRAQCERLAQQLAEYAVIFPEQSTGKGPQAPGGLVSP